MPAPSPIDVAELEDRWRRLTGDAGCPDGAEDLGADLLARYGESHRRYHDRRHLLEVLRAVDLLSGPEGSSVVTRFAAWFHDAIYEGRAGADEHASAELARERLPSVGVAAATVSAVAEIVEATAHHLIPGDGPPVDRPTAILLDADLSILASDDSRYDDYADAIRAEHPDVDHEAFRAGRLQALRTLDQRRPLFHTSSALELWEERAHRNLAREIARLSPEPAG